MHRLFIAATFGVCWTLGAFTSNLGQLGSIAFGQSMFAPGAKLEVVVAGGVAGEGPAWDTELGILTSGNGNIQRWSLDSKSSIFRQGAGTNGLLFDPKGNLIACEQQHRRVTKTARDGSIHILADHYQGKKLNTPNDLTMDAQGRIYFSDPRYGERDGMEQLDAEGKPIEGVYRIDPDGSVDRILGRELERPNGVLVSLDNRFLYVADNNNNALGGARKLWRFPLNDGRVSPQEGRVLYDWKQGRGPDGLKQDVHGNLYVAGGLNRKNPPYEPDDSIRGGIYVLDPQGKLLDFLPVPTDEVTNCAFGDPDSKTLYITGGGVLYRIRTLHPGFVRKAP
ncbi:MAG: SMP-30/gluconolactonase/LRE family protein [Pirellulales bacterium]